MNVGDKNKTIMDRVKNAKNGETYYGLHMLPGVAEYREPDSQPYRIFVGEETIKNMDPTFAGKPVFVQHVDEVQNSEPDGYVFKSFYNKSDGKHWVEFVIFSDRGKEAIRNGWKLSNAYIPKTFAPGNLWNGVEYEKEVMSGEYEHLALVPNPRYAESVILTPEEFKAYNEKKELELKKVANSNHKGETSMLNFFKRSKVENATDFENMSVVLPKSKKEVTLSQLCNEMDEHYKKDEEKDPKAPAMANGDEHVEMGGEKMKVNDLVEKHMALKEEHNALKEEHEKLKADHQAMKDAMDEAGLDMGEEHAEKDKDASDRTENEEGLDAGEEKTEEQKKASDKTENKKKNELDEKKKAEAKAKAAALKNAPFDSKLFIKDPIKVDLDKSARGKARYGSAN